MATLKSARPTAEPVDRRVLVLGGVVVLGTITAILDATIVNVAIATLGRRFHASVATIQWVVTAYLLAFASVIPLTGWLCERFGAKRVWMAALFAFAAGSVLASAAWSVTALIVFRIVQGLGGGLLMPVGQTMLARAAGPHRIGRVMSIVGVPMLLAPIFGPVLGGAIVDQASWRWIFLINVPVGAVAMLLSARLLPAAAARPGAALDLRGLALLPAGIAIFVYGMSEAGRSEAPSWRTLAAMAAGPALIAAFTVHARRRGSGALLDVSLFVRRGFAAAAATNLLVGIALFGALILLPLYYQSVRGETPLHTGLLLMPQGIGAALAMPVAGRLTDRIGARAVIPGGLVLALLGTAAYIRVGADTSQAYLATALFAIGLGLGTTIMPSMAVAYQSVERAAIAQATSAINVIQRIAGSVGTALLAVVLQRSIPGGGFLGARPSVLAHAFGVCFGVAFALVVAALAVAFLLPRRPEAA